ncbi:MAG: hypothetical protein ABI955_08875 [Nitrospirota bacterium]
MTAVTGADLRSESNEDSFIPHGEIRNWEWLLTLALAGAAILSAC